MALQTNKYGQQESFIPSRPHESTNFAAASCRTDAHSSDTSTTLISRPAPSFLGRLRRRTPTATHTFLGLTTVPRFLKNARPEAGDTVQLSRHAEPSTRRFRTPQALHAVSDHLVAFTGAVNSLASSPHIVYVELAHNDLCRQYLSPRTVAHELASLVRDILEIPSVHTVIVGEPIWRLRLPPYMRDFHARVREFSQTLRPLIDSIPNTTTWRHCKLWQKNPDYFVADGLHLSDFGNLRYYKSIRYAILPHLPAR
ncbi:hypothetical protein Bbelb_064860 [Branchiostoma belcheri]|nr:hypothetical protein Bbelb_064860 [Branchiostoma belcheri]